MRISDWSSDVCSSDLSLDDTLSFVRGFMLFSMLANLAEDRQGVAAEPGADVASAVAKLDSHGIGRDAVLDLLSHLLIFPVLPPHPPQPTGRAACSASVFQYVCL